MTDVITRLNALVRAANTALTKANIAVQIQPEARRGGLKMKTTKGLVLAALCSLIFGMASAGCGAAALTPWAPPEGAAS